MSLSLGKTAFFILGMSAGALGTMRLHDTSSPPLSSLQTAPQTSVATKAVKPIGASATAKLSASPSQEDLAALAAEKERLRKALEARNQAVGAMANSLAEMRQTVAEDEEEREDRRQAMQERIKYYSRARLDTRMASLSRAANLDDAQYELITSFLEERSNLQMELHSGRWTGELTETRKAEIEEKLETMKFGNRLQEVLDPEQYAEFNSYRKQRNTVAQEAYASRELSRLVDTVKLTDKQLDQAYSAYFQQAEQTVDEGELFERRRMRERGGDIDTQTGILAEILDEEQLSAYRQLLETNRNGPWRR